MYLVALHLILCFRKMKPLIWILVIGMCQKVPDLPVCFWRLPLISISETGICQKVFILMGCSITQEPSTRILAGGMSQMRTTLTICLMELNPLISPYSGI